MRNFFLGISGYLFTIIAFSAALIAPEKYPYLYNNGGFLYFLWEFMLLFIYLLLSNNHHRITARIYDYAWVLLMLALFITIAISEGYMIFSILIVVNFLSSLLIDQKIPSAARLTIRFLILWSSVMIVLPILSIIYEILSLARGLLGFVAYTTVPQSTSGGVLQDPTNALIWGVGYFSMLLIFDVVLYSNSKHTSPVLN